MSPRIALILALALAPLPAAAPVLAETAPPKKERGSGFGAFGSAKDPIKIDADRLDVFDRENKAIFAGNVVAVQGESTIRCSSMTVHYQRNRDRDAGGREPPKGAEAKPAETKPADPADTGAIRQVVCAGPVTVVSKDQVATGDNAVFDKVANRVVVTGNVVLSQCQNVTRGSRLVYDMNTGRANMDPTAGGRVSAMFVPGSKDDKPGGKQAGCPQPPGQAAKPAPKKAQAN
ncbi:LptA/OstA family protein [Methylobacterium isbiliense]|uniref:Lipopolysaccharide export system protein LptA n=1 Tax=Methylobacterium isbiliense TaxID=315478 RepID=A0ABQ4SIG9_9HYPH|nr:LptA/OstA family protein [Methylobacterium isbiliense]MDN3622437.1 LptA/OstA family protein [Methylobacterium isbiliense]GJE01535.1 Lipopolysaccharide export system protein LptA [Methylobacterium isbiliense]